MKTAGPSSANSPPVGLETEIEIFDRTMCDSILPFWVAEGTDPRSDLFWEKFDFGGRPMRGIPHRFMVQARQVATFAQAARTRLCDAERALITFDNALALFSDGGDLSRGLAFSVDERGIVVDPARDAYTHAFALFALASVVQLSGEKRYRTAIEDLLSFVDQRFIDPVAGGLFGCWPDPPSGKAQNPAMHLLEAYLALHEAWPERGFLERAEALVTLAENRLVQNAAGVILEHYTTEWHPRFDVPEGRVFEPGHQFEWAWLIDRKIRLADSDPRPIAMRLWQVAASHGFDDSGFCLDAVGLDFVPAQRTRRLWPHCEAVRAALIHSDRDDEKARAVLAAALGRLNGDFLGRPFAAGWIDRFDEHGAPAVDSVPASSLYHLYGAWEELNARRRQDRGSHPAEKERHSIPKGSSQDLTTERNS